MNNSTKSISAEQFSTPEICDFRLSLKNEFDSFLTTQKTKYAPEDCLTVDLHCHDHNSDVPDELWGRILRLPETWLKTKKLAKLLKKNNCDVFTVTNHNNARSCWDQIAKGEDVLVAAEFTCYFPEYDLFIHVLTYGFSKDQENILNELRSDVYSFLKYAAKNDIPVILPHPLYFYTRNEKIDIGLFEKFAVIFSRFEVLNGQRDLWQSVLTLNWAQGLTSDKIIAYAAKHDLNPYDFGVDPYQDKILTGGSDDHTGIFAGQCGSKLYVENLQERLKTQSASSLALEAIKKGNVAVFGQVAENEKLNIALLDYFSQVATKIEDPGFFRIMLHRGSPLDKVGCFAVSNILLEMQKNKYAMKFFGFIHDAMQGKKPSKLIKWNVPKKFRFCIEYLEQIAESKKQSPEAFATTVNNSVNGLFTRLNEHIADSVEGVMVNNKGPKLENFTTEEITRKFEIPSQLTALFLGGGKRQDNLSNINLEKLVDKVSFPFLITTILAAASLASTRVLYQNRVLLNDFSEQIGKNSHPKRALYLTDTLRDKNGVSNSLSGKLAEAQRANLPIDFLVCDNNITPEPHLYVVKPITTFMVKKFGEQEIRIPDLMAIAQIFYQGGYDRIICSTEGPMALVSLFLQQMFNVPNYFFMHTDWIDFIKHGTELNQYERDRVRRLMRALYNRYDGIFVLNSDHQQWLSSHEMQLDEEKIFLTAHHTQARNPNIVKRNKSDIVLGATDDTPILFIACRISKEKGLFDLPVIITKAKEKIPNLKLVIAGSGPATEELKIALSEVMPDATFLGWQSKEQMAALYLSLDLFIFPSKFDTFGNVILESFVHGMPTLAYNCKGPKDIIEHGKNGFLCETKIDMANAVVEFFSTPALQKTMRANALVRASEYQAEPIMGTFMENVGLDIPDGYNTTSKVDNKIDNNIERLIADISKKTPSEKEQSVQRTVA
ncbi:glycosyltransferase [Colwellia sp. E2M01]|uniref:glycosyltransferase n=1 Tax=Colwellia sp. E2M01 TaxID=2841561 RepID=UPI001C0A111D|nr:glycosyltransferase [Colwellia sp. E2M01]MBU2871834.1 glycosyltransferase [Colwellia sp. E2M01]